MRFHKSLVKKYRARFTVVLQYSLSEQVRNKREPFTTAGHATWLIFKCFIAQTLNVYITFYCNWYGKTLFNWIYQ